VSGQAKKPKTVRFYRSFIPISVGLILYALVFFSQSYNPKQPDALVLSEYYGVLSLGTALLFAGVVDFVLHRYFLATKFEIDTLKSEVSKLEELRGLRDEAKRLTDEKKVDELDGKTGQLTGKVAELTGKVGTLTETVDRLGRESGKLTRKTDELTTKVGKLATTTKAEFKKLSVTLKKRKGVAH
jgi:septal ring factor EnvC (AmiA/AmiB activator)